MTYFSNIIFGTQWNKHLQNFH